MMEEKKIKIKTINISSERNNELNTTPSQKILTQIHINDDVPEKKNSKNSLFTSLSKKQKQDLYSLSWNACSSVDNSFLSWFMCTKNSEKERNPKIINTQVFEIISYLEVTAITTKWVFRLEPEKQIAAKMAQMLSFGKKIGYENLPITTLAYILKIYIRQHLDGIFPVEAIDKLRSCIKKKKWKQRDVILSYLPFVFSEQERRLLTMLFRLFKLIDENQDKTDMCLEGLLGLFGLVLLPQAAFKGLDDVALSQEIISEMYSRDLEILPPEFLVKAKIC